MSGAGAAIGLVAGGLLTDYLNWRWVFFVNVPIGLFIALVAPRVLGESQPQPGKIDYGGAIAGTASLTILVYGITRASNPDQGWSNSGTIACFVIAAVLMAVFIWIEAVHPHPIMPLHIFANRNRSGSYAVMLIVVAAMFAMFYFLTLFVQGILGYSPVKAGLAFLPFTVGIVIGAGLASNLTPKAPPRVIAGVGIVLAIIGLVWFSQLKVDSGYVTGLLLPMLCMSIGMGLIFVSLTLAGVAGVRHEESGIASAVLNTMQQVGGSLGLAILATIAANATLSQFAQAEAIAQDARDSARGVPGVPMPSGDLLSKAFDALTHGYTTAFAVGAAMFVVALIILVVAVNEPRQAHDPSTPVHAG